jgi:hypothetical protein
MKRKVEVKSRLSWSCFGRLTITEHGRRDDRDHALVVQVEQELVVQPLYVLLGGYH